MWWTLLAAGLVSTTDAAQGRARVHELRNRIGLWPKLPRAPHDLRGAMLRAFAHHWPSPPGFLFEDQNVARREAAIALRSRLPDLWQQEWTFDPEIGATLPPPSLLASPRWIRFTGWFMDALATSAWSKDAVRWIHRPRMVWNSNDVLAALTLIEDWAGETGTEFLDMTWDDAVATATTWHDALIGRHFQGPVPPALVVVAFPDGATLERLLTKKDFAAEGTSMGHCVGGLLDALGRAAGESAYWKKSRDGRAALFSYRGADRIPRATLEMDIVPLGAKAWGESLRAAQMHGPHNGEVADILARRRMSLFAAMLQETEMRGEVRPTDDVGHRAWALAKAWERVRELRVPSTAFLLTQGDLDNISSISMNLQRSDALRVLRDMLTRHDIAYPRRSRAWFDRARKLSKDAWDDVERFLFVSNSPLYRTLREGKLGDVRAKRVFPLDPNQLTPEEAERVGWWVYEVSFMGNLWKDHLVRLAARLRFDGTLEWIALAEPYGQPGMGRPWIDVSGPWPGARGLPWNALRDVGAIVEMTDIVRDLEKDWVEAKWFPASGKRVREEEGLATARQPTSVLLGGAAIP